MLVEDENMIREKVHAKMLNSNCKIEKAHVERDYPAHTRHRSNVEPMLGHCLRRLPNIGPTLGRFLVFAGYIKCVTGGSLNHCTRDPACTYLLPR